MTDLFSWALLVYLDFRIGWHAWFFNAAMGSAFLCSIVQQKWRREAGLPTGLEEWQQYGLPVEVGGRTGRRMPAVKQTVRLTPLAWGLAEDYRLSFEELASIHGSGEDGRITDGDLLKYLVARGRVTAAEPSAEATRPTVANTPVTRERRADGGARRWLVAVGIWVVFVLTAIFVRSLNDAPSSSFFVNQVQAAVALAVWLLYVGALFYAVARFAVIQGRTWAEAFGLIIPILNLYLVGRLFWYWAGLAVEVKPEVAQVTAHHALTPEEAHRRFAEDAAKAVRAAEEGSDG